MKHRNGKVALVIGASSGVGKRCAEYLLSENYHVYGTSRKQYENIDNNSIKMITLDVTKEETIDQAVNYIVDIENKIDVVIYCPGYGLAGSIEDTSIEEAKNIFDVNYFGLLKVYHSVLPIMRNQKSGLIINISSVAAFIPIPFQSMYSASKAALESMSEALRMEVKQFGIKVALICPGDMKTNFYRVFTKKNKGSVYEQKCNKAVDVMINDEMNGSDPIVVVKELKKILKQKNPSVRNVVGMQYKFIYILKKFLPIKVVEYIVSKIYLGENNMDIFKKCYEYTTAKEVKKLGLYPYFKAFSSMDDGELYYENEKIYMMGSNNYLGLTQDERVKEAGIAALKQYGTGCSGSRFMNGTLDLHVILEKRLAKFLNKEEAMTFSTGFQSNLGIIPTIAGRNDYIIGDRANHASIIDGCRLSFAKLVKYNHNDMEDLERVLKKIPEDKGKLIVTDGVFSMEGDIANLPEINRLAKKYNARIMVDDAHGLGVVGNHGRGTAEYYGLEDEIDLIVGTFSKSLASLGGFVAGKKDIIEYARHVSRSFIFSASPTPSNANAALEALSILEEEPERVIRLKENAEFFRNGLKKIGLDVLDGETPIIPIMTYDVMNTFIVSKELLKAGVYVNPVIPPAVEQGECLLRTSVTATHTKKQLQNVIDIFDKVFNESNIELKRQYKVIY